MKMHSLRRQVMASVLLLQIICALGFGSVALLHEWRARFRALDTMIQGRSDSLLGAIQDAEDINDNVTIDPRELVLPREDIYAVYAADGHLIGTSPHAPTSIIGRRGEGFSMRHEGHRTYRTLERTGIRIIDRAETKGIGLRRPVTILYAVDSHRIWHEVFEAAGFYASVSAAMMILTAVLIVLVLRRALMPVQELATAAGNVSFRSLEFTPPTSAAQVRELRPLVDTLSTTISGLKHSVEQQNRFLGDATHELKTAVAVVRSSIQLLMMRLREPEEYVEGLEGTFADNVRVEELVARMLAAARFEEQKDDTASHPREDDLSDVVQRVLLRLRPLLATHHVEIETHLSDSAVVPLSADEADVLASNLIVNAAQHSAPGSVIQVAVIKRGDFAVLTVEDHGFGISVDALPHVFERFYREDTSRSRETGGAGLGLSICKSIVDGASGTIAIQSTPDVGTILTVTLPLV